MILVQISDSHISLDVPEGARRLESLRLTVDEINALDPEPDAVIHTGDMANRGKREEYHAAREVLAKLRAPLYVVPGNRDDRHHLREGFVSSPCFASSNGFIQYAVDDHPVRLLGLDTVGDRSNKGTYCLERRAALESALAERPDTPTVVFAHHPPYDVPGSEVGFQFESREVAALLTDALVGAGQVMRLFCGHAHRAAEVELGGIRASTPPSLAEDLRQGGNPDVPGSMVRFQTHRFTPERGFTTDG